MSIQAINSNPPVNNAPTAVSNPVNPGDVAAFQALVAEGTTPPVVAPDATQQATLADFYKKVQYDVVNMCVQYTPTFRD